MGHPLFEQPETRAYVDELAIRLGNGVVAAGYVMVTRQLLHDCRAGVDGWTNEPMPGGLTGLPAQMYGLIGITAREIGACAFGGEFAAQLQSIYEKLDNA